MAARLGRVDEQGSEPLDPPEHGHVVDRNTPLGEEFLKIPIGQPVAQVPTHGDQNDVGRESKSNESGCA
jgi:hypothetical protein